MLGFATLRALALAAVGAAVLLLVSGEFARGGGAPAAPADLAAFVVQDQLKITLTWEDHSDSEQQFILERSSAGAGGPWGVAAVLPADSTIHNDTGLDDGVTYWYRVAAANASGTSGYSNVASGTATALPQPPPGDANCDASVTSIDAALVLQLDAGLIDVLACSLFADVNEDGTANSLDAALILQFVAGLIDSFQQAGASGLRGLVTIGPMCPVLQKGVPCPDQPFSATITIETVTGTEVTSVVSGDDGRFQVELEPGGYVLVPESPNPGAPPFAGEQAVTVVEGAFTEVLVQYDSGIR